MKLKMFLLAVVICSGVYTAMACSYSECGGGNVKCCIDHWGAQYFCKGSGE